jgi:DNA-binding MarR family transcriptional regulator
VARSYETELAAAGVTATQMAILRALEREGAQELSRLAERLVLERTSLYRALGPLEANGFVLVKPSTDARAKVASLSASGRRKIAEALPHWRRAQDGFVGRLGVAEWEVLATKLDRLLASLDAAA